MKMISIISGLLGFLLFIATPFLPVNQAQSSYSWPQNGDLRSVHSPLMSYSPEKLDITIPISQVKNLNEGATNVLSTVPEGTKEETLRGLFIRQTDSGLDVIIRNVVPLSISEEELRKLSPDATLNVTSDTAGTLVWISGKYEGKEIQASQFQGSIDDDVRPMLTGIYTEFNDTPAAAKAAVDAGLKVDVKVDSRFSSAPTLLKNIAMWMGIAMMIVSLWALHQIDKLDRRGTAGRGRAGAGPGASGAGQAAQRSGRLMPAGWWRPRWVDAFVGTVLLIWYFIGANTADDGYLLTMARVSNESGYMANYYRWFGVPESPFGWPFYDLLALMVKISTTSLWMRLPALIASIITWLVLSREVLPRLGVKINNRAAAQWTTAAMFLMFWMAYNNGTRPEPIIAVFSLLTWVSFERAIATHRLLPAAIGTLLATLALGAGPTGLMAVAAVLVSLSALIRIAVRRLPSLGAPKGASKGKVTVGMLAQIAPFLASGTAILVGVFGDQTFRTVMEAISVRSDRGPSLAWYQEYLRYTALLEQSIDGSFARRFAVLMMLFSMGIVVVSMLRNGRVPGAAKAPTVRLLMVMLGTMFFMVFTPTKWTHHFGVYAGIGAALVGLAAVAASHISTSSARNRVLFLGTTLMLFALTLSGPNGWWYISSFGVPWWDKTIQISGIEASSVMLVIALVTLLWGVLLGYFTDARVAREQSTESSSEDIQDATPAKRNKITTVTSAPIGVLTALVIVFSIASMGKGFVAQWPAYTVGKGNVMSLTGNTCQLASDVLVETNTNDSLLPVADGSSLKNSLTNKDSRGFKPNNIPVEISTESSDAEASGTVAVASQNKKNHTQASDQDAAGSLGDGGLSDSGQTDSASDDSASASADRNTGTVSADGGQDSGTAGGLLGEPGINGSMARLPFGLDPKIVPVVGSFQEGPQFAAETTTKWYKLPENREANPLIVFSAAGAIAHYDSDNVFQYGQDIKVEFGKSTGRGQDDFEPLGETIPLDVGTGQQWRNLRVPMKEVPQDADQIRITAVDTNLTPSQWLAITPPRVPEMTSLNEYVGGEASTLIDWSAAFQFPCQRPYDHRYGVAEVPEFRISPDHNARKIHTPVMDYYGGGSVGLAQMTTQATELPTYLRDDWRRDWGVLDRLTTYPDATGQAPKPAELNVETIRRSGFWYNGPMKYNDE